MENQTMTRVKTRWVWAVGGGALLAWNAVARSQVIIDGQRARDNVTGGAVAARAPGNMVNAGVVRAQEVAAFARGGIEIVETSRPLSARTAFLIDAIEIVFEQLNRALLLLENALRLRSGLSPRIPVEIPLPPAANGGANGEVVAEDVRETDPNR